MNPLVILEGPDNTGKTTLGKFLAKGMNGMYFHCTSTKTLNLAMHDYQKNVLENAITNLNFGRPVIIDRHWPSETVYGPIFRPEQPLFDSVEFRSKIADNFGIYVFCDREDAVDAHAKNKNHEHAYSDDDYARIIDGYRRLKWSLMEEDHLSVLEYDVNKFGSRMWDFQSLIRIRYTELTST